MATPLADVAAFREILAQPLRVGVRIGQRDIAVRPDEIEGPPPEPGSPHGLLPCKPVEGQLQCGADVGQAASRLSVRVHLPRQRRERGEVVVSRLRLDPGPAITAPDGPALRGLWR